MAMVAVVLVVVIMIVSYRMSFMLIPWVLKGLQNPYGCGNSHNCLRSQEVKSV